MVARVHACLRGVRFPFLRLHGAHEATMFSHTDSPPRLRGMTWSTVRPGALAAAVLAGPRVASQDCPSRDLPTVDVARDAYVADQADHAWPVKDEALRVERTLAALQDLCPLLQHQDGGPTNVADVDRLVAGVEDEHGDCRMEPSAVDRPRAVW